MATNTLTKPTSPGRSTIGLKLMMAVSGLLFVFFVLMHMYGNLKILAGHELFNEYAHHLRTMFMPILPYSGFLWLFRIVLLVAVIAHIYSAATLWKRAKAARGTRYAVNKSAAASASSKAMRWGGIALLLFLIWHLLQFTIVQFNVGPLPAADPASLVVSSFQVWWVTLIYIGAMVALGLHLHHGTWSACQTLGFTNTAKARAWAKGIGLFVAVVVVVGFLIPPLAIQFGLIH
ncbi:succinate dehydrogenase cytochrome b subunit [Dermatophilus congolensis]|uniref:succinate dehydrogenase cytochrome b subunit n=1 Tax=Dermatophilus congolensis TaxID=1863 RepID=UPI001AAE4E2E|nr:succinate dehydrogenase cytochrome b subunit [Dermatophilus congolensis]MBO3152303.1 succinate dehydrogenase cytochrome b subunit [Dermatophilus congolensis]MBO3160684.1 succinate dehydrogenase cytochrome b subunit [Dermatophilus congolensis]MBO3163592.1 succinate dehydrogenase cytochrome b subunit [Dermatophilus congolensis]MBO3177138.1 succinate dehydrogenase cytochrome b subunit [Dermatophilus congolensis]